MPYLLSNAIGANSSIAVLLIGACICSCTLTSPILIQFISSNLASPSGKFTNRLFLMEYLALWTNVRFEYSLPDA